MEVLNNYNYWSEEKLRLLAEAKSFKEVADVAISVLRSMPTDIKISELCGPISTGGFGDPRKNLLLFERCVEELRIRDFNPLDVTPMEKKLKELERNWKAEGNSGYCFPILETVYGKIFQSGFIKRAFFLPNWETSFGARWEHKTLNELGIKILNFPDIWFQNIMEELEEKFSEEPL
jgi:hypothetical protein